MKQGRTLARVPNLFDRIRSWLPGAAQASSREAELAEIYGPLWQFISVFGGYATKAGVSMDPAKAMQISTVRRCVKINASGVATLPLDLWRRTADGGKERATDHPLYRLVKVRANRRHTACEFRSLIQSDIELHGSAYALKVVINGQLRELLPLEAGRMEVKEERDGRLTYRYSAADRTGSPREYPADRIIHWRGPFGNGICGANVVTEFRELLGLAYAVESFLSHTFANGARLSGVAETDQKLTDKAYGRIREFMDEQLAGVHNAGRIPIFEENLKLRPFSQTNHDAQVVDIWQQVTAAIARIFDIPLHMLASHIAQPRANMEQQAREWVNQGLLSRLVRFEQRLDADLLENDPDLFFQFNTHELLRADTKARFAAYSSAVGRPWMTPNEARIAENMNPLDGLETVADAPNASPFADPSRTPRDDDEDDGDGVALAA